MRSKKGDTARHYLSISTNQVQSTEYSISTNQKILIDDATNWIVAQVKKNLNSSNDLSKLPNFWKSVNDFLADRFHKLGCANLRTIGSNAQLYSLAAKVGIPHDALPEYISLIVNQSCAFYYKGSVQYIIAQY